MARWKNPPVAQETQIQSLGRGSLDEGMATSSKIFLESPMDRGADWAVVHGVCKVEYN